MNKFRDLFPFKAVLLLFLTVVFFFGLDSCNKDSKIYTFNVQNNSSYTLSIDCWSEITVSGSVSPYSSGVITLENARDVEYVELVAYYSSGYWIGNYATFDVVVDPDGFALLSE